MANFLCEYYSDTLDSRTNFNVMIPDECTEDVPVVFLLHGLCGNQNDWQIRTAVDRYCEERQIAIVVPFGGKSFFCDMKYGDKYGSYIGEELLNYVRKIFPISKKREKTFVAGMSMGGYGALRFALTKPENYAACAAFAGTMDIQKAFQREERRLLGTMIWGEDKVDHLAGSEYDLYELARRLEEKGTPDLKIYHACGTEDPLYEFNADFRAFMEKSSFPYEYYECPGAHKYVMWDHFIEKALDFFVQCMKDNGARP